MKSRGQNDRLESGSAMAFQNNHDWQQQYQNNEDYSEYSESVEYKSFNDRQNDFFSFEAPAAAMPTDPHQNNQLHLRGIFEQLPLQVSPYNSDSKSSGVHLRHEVIQNNRFFQQQQQQPIQQYAQQSKARHIIQQRLYEEEEMKKQNPQQRLDNIKAEEKVSFDHILSDIGIGTYQYLFYFVMATLGLVEGAQVSVFTIMIPLLKNEWKVDDDANSLQVCLVFVGFQIGSMLSGQIADRFGRRGPFLYSSFFTAFFTLIQIFTQNIVQMTIIRFLCAIFVGFFGPLGVTLLAEVTPLAVRGRFMSLVTVSFSLGQLYGQFIGYFTLESLDRGNWRALIFWTGIPGIIAWVVAFFYLDESARFGILDGKFEDSFRVLSKMNRMNGNQLQLPRVDLTQINSSSSNSNKRHEIDGRHSNDDYSISAETKAHLKNWSIEVNKTQVNSKKGNVAQLFDGEGKLITPLVWFNWFTLSFMYYGILVLMPKMMMEIQQINNSSHHQGTLFIQNNHSISIFSSSNGGQSAYSFDNLNGSSNSTSSKSDSANDMVQLALSTFTEMIAASIASFLIEIKGLGRKNSMIICFTIQAISSLVVFYDGMQHFVLWASLCKFFLSMTFIFTYQFTAEIYPTKIRTTGIGMANGIGRSGGSVMPWTSQYLQRIHLFAPFLLFSCLSLLTALIDFVLPFDTLGRELDAGGDGNDVALEEYPLEEIEGSEQLERQRIQPELS